MHAHACRLVSLIDALSNQPQFFAGQDATEPFLAYHPTTSRKLAVARMPDLRVGAMEPKKISIQASYTRAPLLGAWMGCMPLVRPACMGTHARHAAGHPTHGMARTHGMCGHARHDLRVHGHMPYERCTPWVGWQHASWVPTPHLPCVPSTGGEVPRDGEDH
jgi:hypothetical protein